MRRSPSSFTRLTRPPAATSLDSTTGIQYCRRSAPIGVSDAVRVKSSLSSLLSIGLSSIGPSVHGLRRGTHHDASVMALTAVAFSSERSEEHTSELQSPYDL